MQHSEQSINNILMLKSFVQAIGPIYEALAGAHSALLVTIRDNFRPERIKRTTDLIEAVINDDVTYVRKPLDLRNQRTYAVKVYHFSAKLQCILLLYWLAYSLVSVAFSMLLGRHSRKLQRTCINMWLTSMVSHYSIIMFTSTRLTQHSPIWDASWDQIWKLSPILLETTRWRIWWTRDTRYFGQSISQERLHRVSNTRSDEVKQTNRKFSSRSDPHER